MGAITRDLAGAISIADNICVFGIDEKHHDENPHNLMLRTKANGLVFNNNKNVLSRSQKSPFSVQSTASRE